LHALIDLAEKTRLRDRLFIPGLFDPFLTLLFRFAIDRFNFGAPLLHLARRARICAQALAHLFEQLRQRYGGIRGNRHMHRQKPHVVTDPALLFEIEQSHVNDFTGWRDDRREVAALAHRRPQRHPEAGYIQGEHHVGILQRLFAGHRQVQNMGARERVAAVGINHGRA
jgi:hypothetical protein